MGVSRGASFRVAEALKKDAGRGIARLDPADMERLGVGVGSFVRVGGKGATVCKVMPQFAETRGAQAVQLDGVSRENAGVGLGDAVSLEAAELAACESLTLRPRTMSVSERDLEYIGSLLDGLAVSVGDVVRATLFGSRSAEFVVESSKPSGETVIVPTTRLLVSKRVADGAGGSSGRTCSYEDVGGLGSQLARIRETIELPLRYPQVFERLGIDPPKGVLLHGPPGTGKTLIARTIAHESDASFFVVSGPEIVHRHYGESEKHLREVWDKACKRAPSIVFIDEIDSIAPKREHVEGEVEKRIVAQLLALMDGMERRGEVVVIAATNLPNNIDPALRRPGRFDREIEIPIPDARGRRQILDIHSRGMPIDAHVDIDEVARITHGFVGADLQALCREAAMACLRDALDEADLSRGELPYDRIARLEVSMEHFRVALAEVEPSAVREVFVETPRVSWNDVGGLEHVKRRLKEAVEWPLVHAGLFREAGVRPAKGILLAGPPGVGKTLIAKAVASETEANFVSVKGPELLSKFVGASEERLREIFRKARQASPCVVFFDEIDALVTARGAGGGDGVGARVLAQFLAEFDGVEELNGVLVLGATNRLDLLDPAMLRPGRFDEVVELDEPDHAARSSIIAVHMRGRPFSAGLDPDALARLCPHATGAQIAGAVRRASLAAVRRVVRARECGQRIAVEISLEDLRWAFEVETGVRKDEAA